MSYLDQDDAKLIDDIYKRKEFYWTKQWDIKKDNNYSDIIPRFVLDDLIDKSLNLKLSSYQLFVKNFMNINTPYKKLLLKWMTGTGKTIGSLSIAMNFINQYRMENEIGISEIGSVVIISFSKPIYQRELLKYPEFGFISKAEKSFMEKLERIASTGSEFDRLRYKDFRTKIKKRFSNRSKNGFFKFYGYKEFVNALLVTDVNINDLSEDKIRQYINEGKINYDPDVVKLFKNSLMICDEIHNVYNSQEKNNWGIAIQAILDIESSCRAVFVTATPLNNSPTEIVDLLNMLAPTKKRLTRSDFFDSGNTLKPGALEKIGKLSRGRVSFLQDVNPKYYPSISIEGEKLEHIPYLSFIRCPMSEYHYHTYKSDYTGVLAPDGQYILDFVIEDPENPDIGIYKTDEIKTALTTANQTWKDKYGINFIKGKITGDFMERDRLIKYSTKYVAMLDEIMKIIKSGGGKIFIYHNYVHMSGVMFIEQVLLRNGIIDEFSASSDNTICMRCGLIKKLHKNTVKMGGSEGSGSDTKESDGSDIKIYKDCAIWKFDDSEVVLELKKKSVSCGDTICYFDIDEFYYVPVGNLADALLDHSKLFDTSLLEIMTRLDKSVIFQLTDYCKRIKNKLLKMNYTNLIKDGYEFFISPQPHQQPPLTHGAGEIISFTNKVLPPSDPEHLFVPTRFIILHNEIEKSRLEQSLEKYNSIRNNDGNQFFILLGSRIMKESHNTNSIRNQFIMNRPINIPTLIQIRGRTVRKGSHNSLPPNQRNVNIKIFTSCLPIKYETGPDRGKYVMSHEEEKYKEKVFSFKTIQEIEKVLHENAIDSGINQSMINQSGQIGQNGQTEKKHEYDHDPLSPLKFIPKMATNINKEFKLDELNLSTFNIYHRKKEIDTIKFIIKRLFIEISGVWEHNDLFEAIKGSSRYENEINVRLIDENNFIIAIDQLVWHNTLQYVEPFIKTTDEVNSIIDRLYDSSDKIITLPGGQDSLILEIPDGKKTMYILFPINNNEPYMDLELPYRIIKSTSNNIINMNNFMKTKRIDFDYDDKKKLFYNKFADIPIENMENVVCEYGTNFHMKFIEECIEYVFRAWVDPKSKRHDYHEFYFKMIYYYDLLSLIIWAHTIKPKLFKDYANFVNVVKSKDIKLKLMAKYEKRQEEYDINPEDSDELSSSGIINLLKTSINRSSNIWIPREFREEYDKILEACNTLYDGRKKKSDKFEKVDANLLPVGHFISNFPKIYKFDEGFTEDPTYSQSDVSYIENDLIIGYDDRTKTGVHIRFKLRAPNQNIKKYKDARLIEKGVVCKSKTKSELRKIATIIGVENVPKINVEDLCSVIRTKLIRMELVERIKKTNIKYFYFHYEDHVV